MASIGELRHLLRAHGAVLRVSRFRALGARRGIAYVEYHFEISLADGSVHASSGRSLELVLEQTEALLRTYGIAPSRSRKGSRSTA